MEIFFGIARQRHGGNFYINVGDVLAASKVQRLHQLMKNDVALSTEKLQSACKLCNETISLEDTEILIDLSLEDTEALLSSSDSLKHKVIFIAGYLSFKYDENKTPREEEISSEYLNTLNRGGLTVPTLAETHFVRCGYEIFNKLSEEKKFCRNYLKQLFSLIKSPMSMIENARHALANLLQKAYVLDKSDIAREIGCLRRREKLSN